MPLWIMEAQQVENRKCMEQMTELHRGSVAATTATQAKLDALVRAVTDLPGGAQVLRNAFNPLDTTSAPASGTSETASAGTSEQETKAETDAGHAQQVYTAPHHKAPGRNTKRGGCLSVSYSQN